MTQDHKLQLTHSWLYILMNAVKEVQARALHHQFERTVKSKEEYLEALSALARVHTYIQQRYMNIQLQNELYVKDMLNELYP